MWSAADVVTGPSLLLLQSAISWIRACLLIGPLLATLAYGSPCLLLVLVITGVIRASADPAVGCRLVDKQKGPLYAFVRVLKTLMMLPAVKLVVPAVLAAQAARSAAAVAAGAPAPGVGAVVDVLRALLIPTAAGQQALEALLLRVPSLRQAALLQGAVTVAGLAALPHACSLLAAPSSLAVAATLQRGVELAARAVLQAVSLGAVGGAVLHGAPEQQQGVLELALFVHLFVGFALPMYALWVLDHHDARSPSPPAARSTGSGWARGGRLLGAGAHAVRVTLLFAGVWAVAAATSHACLPWLAS